VHGRLAVTMAEIDEILQRWVGRGVVHGCTFVAVDEQGINHYQILSLLPTDIDQR
jgi:hypothetical protein